MLWYQFQPGIIPSLIPAVSSWENIARFIPEIIPSSNPGCETDIFPSSNPGCETDIIPSLIPGVEKRMISGHKRKDIQFWTWYYSCLKTWFWNSFYETGKMTGFKPDIIPVYEPGSETAIMKLEKYLVWSNLKLFQVCNKLGFETSWFLVHFKRVNGSMLSKR